MTVNSDELPRGALAPLATAFGSDGGLALEPYRRQAEWLIAEDIDGLVVAGSTGEGYTVEPAELAALVDCALEASAARVPVLASIIADDTRRACLHANAIRGKDVAAIQVVPPHYFFRVPDDGLVEFYARVAEAAECPILIYNCVPWAQVSAALAGRILAECPGVLGVKQSIRDMSALVSMTATIGAGHVYAAIDPALMSCYAIGCVGSISALSTVAPRATSRLFDAVARGNHAEAMWLHRCLAEFCLAIEGPDMPAVAKALLEIQGIPVGVPRSPLRPVLPQRRQMLAHAYEALAASLSDDCTVSG